MMPIPIAPKNRAATAAFSLRKPAKASKGGSIKPESVLAKSLKVAASCIKGFA